MSMQKLHSAVIQEKGRKQETHVVIFGTKTEAKKAFEVTESEFNNLNPSPRVGTVKERAEAAPGCVFWQMSDTPAPTVWYKIDAPEGKAEAIEEEG